MKDYYLILGVPRNCSQKDIKKAYRNLAKQHHPDASHDPDETQFRNIQEAYENLGDEEKRKSYDNELRASEREELQAWTNHAFTISERRVNSPVYLWGSHGFTVKPRLDFLSTPVLEIILSPSEARKGMTIPLQIPAEIICPLCHGSGFLGAFFAPCPECQGRGAVTENYHAVIKIPPHVASGSRFRVHLPGQGNFVIVVIVE
ncbi:hypothetical protein B6D60_03260 [candidate division KSB1 bacterium 4484_87]|nr:MAG: hypothetical protein B6D60_03260 [candidate division KSB1 bacterium 4484_87]